MRFPREESRQHSMVKVWYALFRIAAGKKVDFADWVLTCRWFGVPFMYRALAKQLTRQGSDMKFRFPRRRRA